MSFRRAGHVVGGKYELARLLGRGSMGEVWVAHHRTLREQVALKVLTRAIGSAYAEDGASAMARFRMEAQIAAHLSRKTRHIVRVTDHGEEEGLAYLVMELLEGQTLEGRIMRRGPIDPEDVVKVVAQTARALEEAHDEGIVHRDLKPANVFLTEDEDGRLLVKLLDFGIARTTHTHRVAHRVTTGDGIVFGTPGYMSPEQACAAKVDPRCDLWALATVAYEALTGELPITGSDTGELLANLHARRIVPLHARNPRLPEGLRAFFDKAFALRIEARFASAGELAAALARAAEPPIGAASPDVAAPAGTASLLADAAHAAATLSFPARVDPPPASPASPPLFTDDDRSRRPTLALGADDPPAPTRAESRRAPLSFTSWREPPRIASVLVAFAALVGSVLVVAMGRTSSDTPERVVTTTAAAPPALATRPAPAADDESATRSRPSAANSGPLPPPPVPSALRGEPDAVATSQGTPVGAALHQGARATPSTPAAPAAAKPAPPGAAAPRRPIDKSEVL